MPPMPLRPARRQAVLVLAVLVLAPLGLAGCDKCGNRIRINAPALQHACGDNAEPAR